MSPGTARTILGVSRMGVGVLSLLAPSAAAKVFGLDPRRSNRWITRLFASRELVLAGALLGAPPERRQDVARAGVVIDSADAVSSLAEYRSGGISGYTMVSGGLGAVLFAVLGLLTTAETEAR